MKNLDETEQKLRIRKLENEIRLQEMTIRAQEMAMAQVGVVFDRVNREFDEPGKPGCGDSIWEADIMRERDASGNMRAGVQA